VPRSAVPLAVAVLALALAAPAGAKTHWLCKPGTNAANCMPSLSTTTLSPTGAVLGVRTVKRDKDPKYDCFYVYPTVSDQQTQTATFAIDPEINSIVLYQAARYTQHCRLFAPVYRQLTLQGIGATGSSGRATPPPFVYTDVRDAWRDYLKNFNDGRPVVLLGHSQGSFVLRNLVRQEVDPKPKVRDLLVSGLLLGGNVLVAQGQNAGGDFQNIPACRSPKQFGCIVAFSTFDQPVPAAALFGRTTQPGVEVLCTDPAALGGGEAPVTSIYPSAPFAPGTTIAAATGLVGVPRPDVSTTWIEAPDSYQSSCVNADGADVLQVSPLGGAPVLNPVPDANWGLHLTDANIAQGTQVDLVQHQYRAYAAKHESAK
jgi:Protein of unknown function (DUF3089)